MQHLYSYTYNHCEMNADRQDSMQIVDVNRPQIARVSHRYSP